MYTSFIEYYPQIKKYYASKNKIYLKLKEGNMELGEYKINEVTKLISQFSILDEEGNVAIPFNQRNFLKWKSQDELHLILDIENETLIITKK